MCIFSLRVIIAEYRRDVYLDIKNGKCLTGKPTAVYVKRERAEPARSLVGGDNDFVIDLFNS